MAGGRSEAKFSFDPTDPSLIVDPYPTFAHLREHDPVHWSDQGYWVASRHADVRATLMDRDRFGQGDFVRNIQLFYGPEFDVLAHPSYRWLSDIFVFQDPPRHTRLRGLVTQALTARRVAAMRPRIQQICDGLIDALAPTGTMDAIHDFAYRLPTRVMCDMLGITDAEAPEPVLQKLNQAIAEAFLVFGMEALPADMLARADRQMLFMEDFFGTIFANRRRTPGDDLATDLVNARDGTSTLSDAEMVTVAIGLFGAGFETTAHMIANGLLAFGRSPDQWIRLVADLSLARNASDEVLRLESSLIATYRTALVDADVAGVPVEAGQRVLCLLGAGNRDPRVFAEPDAFDIGRADASRHLSFGGGIHFCVGAQLARLEGEIAFETLARRLPGLRVATDAPAWRPGLLFRGMSGLSARWDPTTARA
jgi:cytochrome P450